MLRRPLAAAVALALLFFGAMISLEAIGVLFHTAVPDPQQRIDAFVARLEAVDVEGLPSSLAAQVFGEWARAGSRLCRERGIAEPLRYAPDPGRGAIVARDFGIPAVVLRDATRLLGEGVAVKVDGRTGRVELVRKGAGA